MFTHHAANFAFPTLASRPGREAGLALPPLLHARTFLHRHEDTLPYTCHLHLDMGHQDTHKRLYISPHLSHSMPRILPPRLTLPSSPAAPGVGSWSCSGTRGTHLSDLGVGALHTVARPVKPGAGRAGAVLVEGAPALAAAPATLELSVGLQAQATALPLGCTLVEVDCEDRGTVTDRAGEDLLQLTLFLQV